MSFYKISVSYGDDYPVRENSFHSDLSLENIKLFFSELNKSGNRHVEEGDLLVDSITQFHGYPEFTLVDFIASTGEYDFLFSINEEIFKELFGSNPRLFDGLYSPPTLEQIQNNYRIKNIVE